MTTSTNKVIPRRSSPGLPSVSAVSGSRSTQGAHPTQEKIGTYTLSSQIRDTPSMKELRQYLKRGRISARSALQIPQSLRMLVRQDALDFELKGNVDAVVELYTQLSRGLVKLINKVPRIYRPLIESSADFWQSEADKTRKRIPLGSLVIVPKATLSSPRRPRGRRSSPVARQRPQYRVKEIHPQETSNDEKTVKIKHEVLHTSQSVPPKVYTKSR